MNYDPKLKEAMAEMKAVMKKHDIAGALALVSKTHSEYLYHFPTWSAAQLTEDGIRFRAKSSEHQSKEAAQQALIESLHVILQIVDLSTKAVEDMGQLIKQIREVIEFDHTPYKGHTPHRLH